MARRRSVIRWVGLGAAALLVVVLATVGFLSRKSTTSTDNGVALASNPNVDPGTKLGGQAPDFTLSNQFGQPVSLHSFKGKVVLLAFNDSECTTICPLTTTAMVNAKGLLGKAGRNVALLGVDANPDATSIADVRAYSRAHQMLHQWDFVTGSLPQLKRVWKAYKIAVQIEQGQIDHTPALFAIDTQGRLAKLYITQMSYASIDQLAQVLAQEMSELLPGHPRLASEGSYEQVPPISPAASVTLPRAGGGTIGLGPGKPHLYAFFASWVTETSDIAKGLDILNGYSSAAAARGLPAVTGVDEGSVEPSPEALPRFLGRLRHPPSYPVAIDRTGRVADGYQVEDQPWLVLTSASGRILWYYDASTQGWLSRAALINHVKAALKASPKEKPPPTAAAVPQVLAGSPEPLASLHNQASQVLGSEQALAQRLQGLRGYSVVINAWASWCGPCRTEFPLLASASVRYGRKVAFLGFDTNDSLTDAKSFLATHPVSYPSYQGTTSQVHQLLAQGLIGLPTTIFLDPQGKVTYVHSGQYDSQGTLDEDVGQYALGSS